MVDEAEKEITEEDKPSKKKKIFGIIKKLIKILLILSILSAGGYFGYKYFKANGEKYSSKTLINVKSNDIKLKFAFENIREIYSGIVKIDSEIVLIDNEIERINKIETDYPKQKKITSSEKKIWNKIRKKLVKVLEKVELNLEIIFVTYNVNPEKGLKIIKKTNNNLKKLIEDVLGYSKAQTQNITTKKDVSFFQKIKNFF
jgi:hypothetical protein